jgi:hypothetical protein
MNRLIPISSPQLRALVIAAGERYQCPKPEWPLLKGGEGFILTALDRATRP